VLNFIAMCQRLLLRFVRACLVCTVTFQASASVLFNDITTDAISPGAGFFDIGGPGFVEADSFAPPAGHSYILQELDVSLLALNDRDPSAGTIADLFLYADSSGLPGSLLESFAVQVPDIFPPMTNSITKVQSKLHPILNGGSLYWFGVGPDPNSVSDFVSTILGLLEFPFSEPRRRHHGSSRIRSEAPFHLNFHKARFVCSGHRLVRRAFPNQQRCF